MDCKEFHERHAPFVDLMCSVQDELDMREHMRGCQECAKHDTRIRRSLMLVRSLPSIEPSPGFRARLDERLREVRATPARPAPRRTSAVVMAAIAAGAAFIAWFAIESVGTTPTPEIAMPPVVAMTPQAEPQHVATPAMVAAMPTGMSVWPAIMLASQAQVQLVAAELATER